MNKVLHKLWDDAEERRKYSAIHEAGHAAYAWFFSNRDLKSAPFNKIKLDSINDFVIIEGGIEIKWNNISNCAAVTAAVALAGHYAQLGSNNISNDMWVKNIKNCDMTSGVFKDSLDVDKIACENNINIDELLKDALSCLKKVKNINDHIKLLAILLDKKGILEIDMPEVISILNSIPHS